MPSLSSILVGGLVFFLITSILLWLILNATMPSAFVSLSPSSGVLNKSTRIGNISNGRNNFLSTPGGTISVFLYCSFNNKTAGLRPNENVISILRLGQVLDLQILPGGASNGPTTQLRIRTQGASGQVFETIVLQDFPMQSWVHFVLVREGRRYTAYYNGKVAGSARTINFPIISSSALSIGNSKLNGEFIYPKIAAIPYRIQDVQKELATTADTRHVPRKPFFEYGSFKFGCPGGIFCFSTSNEPQGTPLRRWETPYA